MQRCPACEHESSDAAKFCPECGTALVAGDAAAVERRLVTAVFCDVVGSTELGERLDPESLRKVMDPYFESMRGAIERHGGMVEKFIGDAVVGVFGLPATHEDDAVRAARAALEMREAIPTINAEVGRLGVELEIRVGIQSGEVIANAATAQMGGIGGDTFNTAARLQSSAPAGAIVVGERAARLLDGWASLEPLPSLGLKGKAEPVRASVLLSVSDERRSSARTPFVGRARYLDALRRAFEDAVQDRSGVLVTVLGVPGIGKSRLAGEIAEELRGRATVLVGHTPAYGEGVALAPVVDIVRAASGTPSADPSAVAEGLRELVAGRADATAVVDRLGGILGADESVLGVETSWAVRRLLECLAAERPVVVVVEDLHWAAEALVGLVDDLADRVRGAVLLVCLARPEFLDDRPTWGGGKARALTITLGPLAADEAEDLVSHLLGDAPDHEIRRLTTASEGNPLYLEQLAAMFARGRAPIPSPSRRRRSKHCSRPGSTGSTTSSRGSSPSRRWRADGSGPRSSLRWTETSSLTLSPRRSPGSNDTASSRSWETTPSGSSPTR